ncbi:MAG: hypothetical protein H6621_08610 [Halobacteriovoraceae bacterium]|nr:hypothetical protein [Halobacteriovoraceae bacterium]MCB9095114.1 hypothetical protein [Halobacteriovoraceae bacterium]
MKKNKIAGIGVGSGKKDSFYFCVLEHFEKEKRWFLKTCQKLNEFQYPETEDSILSWVKDFELETIVVDFPLSMPTCSTCKLDCPGSSLCPVEGVVKAREEIKEQLDRDHELYEKNPKKYEHERLKAEQIGEKSSEILLTRSLKRKLKKGFVPYWHRTIDLWVWLHYHDELLYYFQTSFDSFGQDSMVQILRFQYLARHFPDSVELKESNYFLCLLELLKAGIISKRDLGDLRNSDSAPLGRIEILKKIEASFDLFVYEKDRETLLKNPKAFQSFILTVSGIGLLKESIIPVDSWALDLNKSFFVPQFEHTP